MPDIFESEETNARDRRLTDETSSPHVDIDTQNNENNEEEVVEKTLSPKEDAPEIHSATPLHPERHVGTNQMHIFSAYCERPSGISFDTQEDNEEILLLLRRTFYTNVPWIFFGILFALLPIFFFTFVPLADTPLALIPGQYVFVLVAFYYLIILSYGFVNFMTWYFNTSLITNKRIVDIDFADLVYKNVSETKMDLVQDVTFTQTGVLRALFNFGDVLVQTAGTLENFDLTAIPHPDRTADVIETLIGKGRAFPGV